MGPLVTRFLEALRGELRAALHDPAALLVLCAAPVVYALIYPLPYSRQAARDVPVVVVDEDGSALSRRLARMVDATEQAAVICTVHSAVAAEALVLRGDAHGIVVIPAGTEARVQRGERAHVGVYGDASRFMYYSQVANGAAQAVGTLSAGIEIRRHQAGGATEDAARSRRDPLPVVVRASYNPTAGYGFSVVPGVYILLLQQTMLVGIGTLAGGRRERVPDPPQQPLASRRGASLARRVRRSVHIGTWLLGRGAAYVLLYVLHACLYYGVMYRIYGMPLRAPAGVALLFLLPFLAATAFLGITVSTLFREREIALPVLVVTSLPALFISGFPWPAEALPAWLRAAAHLLPSTSGIDGAVRITQLGASLAEVAGAWLNLWLLCAAFFGAALVLAGRQTRAAVKAARAAA